MTYNTAMSTWHDASIATVKNGELELLLESERYSHIKHDVMSQSCMQEFEKNNFIVEDDGPGIPTEMLSEALKPFSRLDPARNQDKGMGVGLGLPIASDIAQAHGGSLKLLKSKKEQIMKVLLYLE